MLCGDPAPDGHYHENISGMKGILKKVEYCNISRSAAGDRNIQRKLNLAS